MMMEGFNDVEDVVALRYCNGDEVRLVLASSASVVAECQLRFLTFSCTN